MLTSLRLRPILVAATVALASLVGVAPVSPAAAAGPPECRYDHVLTRYSAYREWGMTLLDTIFMVNKGYVPAKLVSSSNAGLNAGGKVRRFVIPDLRAMVTAARKANAGLRVVSAYRSYAMQRSVFQREASRYGATRARLMVARPGHSEHQLGTTIDFGSARNARDAWDYSDWATTAAGSWIKQNGWKYGFVMSYPKKKRGVTCNRYEPWHWPLCGT